MKWKSLFKSHILKRGYEYYLNKKVESKSYQKGNFKSFGELMNSCKEWGKSHETP